MLKFTLRVVAARAAVVQLLLGSYWACRANAAKPRLFSPSCLDNLSERATGAAYLRRDTIATAIYVGLCLTTDCNDLSESLLVVQTPKELHKFKNFSGIAESISTKHPKPTGKSN